MIGMMGPEHLSKFIRENQASFFFLYSSAHLTDERSVLSISCKLSCVRNHYLLLLLVKNYSLRGYFISGGDIM